MNVNISMKKVMPLVFWYLNRLTNVYAVSVKHGYKGFGAYVDGASMYSDIDEAVRELDNADYKLRDICDITGLCFWALVNIAKFIRKNQGYIPDYFDTWYPSENEIEKLYHSLVDDVETGIYKNEFFDRAITRLQKKEYFEQKKQAYLDAEYEEWVTESERDLSFPDPDERSDDEWDYYWSSRGVQTVF